MFYYIGLIIGAIFILLGLLGSVLPVLPGPPLSFIGLFLVALVRNFSPPLTPTLILIMLIIAIAVTVVDYFIPLIGAKKYGTSKWGIYGSVLGMILELGASGVMACYLLPAVISCQKGSFRDDRTASLQIDGSLKIELKEFTLSLTASLKG